MQTIELNGRAIAVMGGNREQVQDFVDDDGFRADLLAFLGSDSRPLWDGRGVFSPAIRAAGPQEAAAFHRSFTDAVSAGEVDADDPADWFMFLVDVHEAEEGGER